MRLEWLGGFAAIALLATIGSASAVPIACPGGPAGCTVNATVSTNGSAPFALENFGNTTTGAGFHSAAPIPMGIETISFVGGAATMGGAANPSGLYSGSVGNVATSPFLQGGAPSADIRNYLVAQPGGNVAIAYTQPQTAFNLLWGSVDTSDARNLLFSGGTMITGDTIRLSLGGTIDEGVTNAAVEIAGLAPFMLVTARDETGQLSAFEFVKGAPVPEPASLALLGAALVGFGLIRRRRKSA